MCMTRMNARVGKTVFRAVPAVGPPACSTGDSCKPAPSPQPAIVRVAVERDVLGCGQRDPGGFRACGEVEVVDAGAEACACVEGVPSRAGETWGVCERQARVRYSVERSKASTKIGRG